MSSFNRLATFTLSCQKKNSLLEFICLLDSGEAYQKETNIYHSELLMSCLGKREVKELLYKLEHFWDLNILLILNFIWFIKFSLYKNPVNLWKVLGNGIEKELVVDRNWKYNLQEATLKVRGGFVSGVLWYTGFHNFFGGNLDLASVLASGLLCPPPFASGQVGLPLRAMVWLIGGFQASNFPRYVHLWTCGILYN